MASVLEEMDEVVRYVKNQNLGFTIPYTLDGEEHGYLPDFLVRIRDLTPPTPLPPGGRGEFKDDDLLNLIVEVSGEAR